MKREILFTTAIVISILVPLPIQAWPENVTELKITPWKKADYSRLPVSNETITIIYKLGSESIEPCGAGKTRWRGLCYTDINLKLVKK